MMAVLTVFCIVTGSILSIHFSRNNYKPVKDIVGRIQKEGKKRNILIGNEYEFIDREILHMSATAEELNSLLQSYNPMIEYNILSGLISKTERERGVLQQRIGLLGFEKDMTGNTAVIIQIRKLLFDIMDEKNLQIFKIHLINLIRDVCEMQCIVSEYKENEIVAMVFGREDTVLSILTKIKEKCDIYPVGSLIIGIGDRYDDYMNFSDSYAEAKEALQYAYFDADKLLFEYSIVQTLKVPEIDILGKYNREFDKYVKSGNLQEAWSVIDYMEETVKKLPYGYEYMKRKLLEMTECFEKYCKEVGIRTAFEDYEERFLNNDRLQDFLLLFKTEVAEVINKRNADMENRNRNLIVVACEFIDNNISSDISISMIADHIGVSEGHLSRMFRKFMAINIVDYITKKRMEEAGKLLSKTSFSIEKIADMVGYRTPHYFSRRFKDTYGYTPSEYREMVRRQKGE